MFGREGPLDEESAEETEDTNEVSDPVVEVVEAVRFERLLEQAREDLRCGIVAAYNEGNFDFVGLLQARMGYEQEIGRIVAKEKAPLFQYQLFQHPFGQ